MKRNTLIPLVVLLLAVAGFAAIRFANGRAQAKAYETVPVRRADLQVLVSADGVVSAAQSALLPWRTSGTVSGVNFHLGEPVRKGDILATLEQLSLPQALILAQADLAAAQKALDDLLASRAAQAEAQRRVEQAEQALEDAQNPAKAQADALSWLAKAQKAVEDARREVEIVQSTASPEAIEAARGVLLLWEHTLERTRLEIQRVERKLRQDLRTLGPGERRDRYEAQLTSLTQQLIHYRRRAEDALLRYNALLKPPDPQDLAAAEARLALAQAQLYQAQRDYDRIQDGTSPADIALLQAQVADARRRALRLADGTDQEQVAAAQARVAAAQASLDLASLKAPFDGVLTAEEIQPGDMVSPGSPAFRLDDLSNLHVDLQVSEVDIDRLRTGQEVFIRLDAVPDYIYAGRVAEVPPVGERAGDLVTFPVNVVVQNGDSRLRPGMTTSVEILLTDIKNVLLVPARAVRFIDGQRVVTILRDGKAQPVTVTLGLSSFNETQVLEGDIQTGDLVILNP